MSILIVEARCSGAATSISAACEEAIMLARQLKCWVAFEFNRTRVLACSTDSAEDLVELWESQNRMVARPGPTAPARPAACERCRFWNCSGLNGSEGGDCMRYPPKGNSMRTPGAFPITYRKTWCGEFKEPDCI